MSERFNQNMDRQNIGFSSDLEGRTHGSMPSYSQDDPRQSVSTMLNPHAKLSHIQTYPPGFHSSISTNFHSNSSTGSFTGGNHSLEEDMEVDDVPEGKKEDRHDSFTDMDGNVGRSASSPQGNYYPDKFLLSGLSDKILEETLKDYIEVISGLEVDKIEYSLSMSAAVVTLNLASEPVVDWLYIEKGIEKRALEGCKLNFRRLPFTTKVCVWHTQKGVDLSSFENYFENVKSGNKNNVAVTEVRSEEEFSVVTFENSEAASSVLSHHPHKLCDRTLVLTAYYDDLGPVRRDSQSITEATFSFRNAGEKEFMERNGYLEDVRREFNLTEVSGFGALQVVLKGEEKAVAEALMRLESLKKSIKYHEVECSYLKMKYLESDEGSNEIMSILKRKGIKSSWTSSKSACTIFALSGRDLGQTTTQIEDHLVEGDIQFENSHFQNLKIHLQEMFPSEKFFLDCQRGKLSFVAQKDLFSKLKMEIGKFSKPKITKKLPVSTESVRLIKSYMRGQWSRFIEDMKAKYEVEITEEDQQYIVYGRQDDVEQVCNAVKAFVKEKTFSQKLTLDCKETERLQKVGDLFEMIEHIEETKECIIKHEMVTIYMPPEVKSVGAVGGYASSENHPNTGHFYMKQKDSSDSGENEWKLKTGKRRNRNQNATGEGTSHRRNQGIKITVKEGAIADAKVDVIVNILNRNMDLDFGAISRSIKEAGGGAVIKACNSIRHVADGDFKRTTGGKLKCKHIFHCSLPKRHEPSAAQMYQDVVYRMLKEADILKCHSIAFPSLGTGRYHAYDASCVASALFTAVQDFDRKESPQHLKEVDFVIYHGDKDILKVFKKSESEILEQARKAEKPDGTHGCDNALPKVKVTSGELAMQTTEVIVNTSNGTLDLDSGVVSKSIVAKAGNRVQSECREWTSLEGSVHPGHFAVTSAGMMTRTKKLYHCNLPSYSGKSIEILKQLVLEILTTAAKYQVKDIAFPALGTGNLKYPPKEVAHAMFQAIHTFRVTQPNSSIKEVVVVIYKFDKTVLKAFQEEESYFLKKSGPKISTLGQSSSYEAEQSGSKKDFGPLLKVDVGPFTVRVKRGDIAQERNTCIVNPIHKNMSLRTGSVSKALFSVGGQDFQDKTHSERDRLSSEHVAIVHLTRDTGVIHLDRQFLENNPVQAICSCLKHSKTKGFKSITFPNLQAGNAEKMAVDLFTALKSMDSMTSVTTVDVSVVIFDERESEIFCQKVSQLSDHHCSKSMEKQHILFTLFSVDKMKLSGAKQTLQEYSGWGQMQDTVVIPSYIKTADIRRIGLQNSNVNTVHIKDTEIQLKGKPVDVWKAVEAMKTMVKGKKEVGDESAEEDSLFGAGNSKQSYWNDSHRMDKPTETTSGPSNEFLEKDSKHMATKSEVGDELVEEDSLFGAGNGKQNNWNDAHSMDNPTWTTSGPSNEFVKSEGKIPVSYSSQSSSTDTKYNLPSSSFNIDKISPGVSSASFSSDSPAQSGSLSKGSSIGLKMTWFFLDPESDELTPYDVDISKEIEQSYLRGEDYFKLPQDLSGVQYKIDFKTMEEYPDSDPNDRVPVLRKEHLPEASNQVFPNTWKSMDKSPVLVFALEISDDLYKKVKDSIEETSGGLPVSVVKIEKIQNKEVHSHYEQKKLLLKKNKGLPEEKMLWHSCTSTDAIVPINNHGMNLHYCKKEYEGPLGEGMEFSESFKDIIQRDCDGNQYAYFCSVLVGSFSKGKPGLRDPPQKVADPNSFYDSVVDRVDRPSKFLVFSDAQVEPEYLVTFTLNAAMS